ncbi:hypothetical protein NQ317_019172, partial [Molorchus minor]
TEGHDITIVKETIRFDTIEQFESWKNDLKRNSKARFSSTNAYKNISFVCHRSGKYISESKGLRHLKTQGSIRLVHCDRQILSFKLTKGDGTCKKAVVTKTHVGHVSDVGHLSLTLEERKQLGIQIASKIPLMIF